MVICIVFLVNIWKPSSELALRAALLIRQGRAVLVETTRAAERVDRTHARLHLRHGAARHRAGAAAVAHRRRQRALGTALPDGLGDADLVEAAGAAAEVGGAHAVVHRLIRAAGGVAGRATIALGALVAAGRAALQRLAHAQAIELHLATEGVDRTHTRQHLGVVAAGQGAGFAARVLTAAAPGSSADVDGVAVAVAVRIVREQVDLQDV